MTVSAGGSKMSMRQQEHEEQEANAIGAAKRETGGGREHEQNLRQRARGHHEVCVAPSVFCGPDDDDDCLSVQLDGSDMSPKAPKTILRQRFTMRQYNLGKDGRLTNLAKAMDPFASNSATMITQSIAAILQPHTSSPSLLIISHAVASLMAMNFGGSGLGQVLSAHLDSLAISPQAKQAIIPALLGMAKFTEMHTQARSVTQPQAVIEPPSSNSGVASATSSGGAHAGYQMYQRPFSSSSGSGYTIWYSSWSDSSIQSPPMISQSKTGHLYVHFDALTKTYQYWMLSVGGQWESVSRNAECPLNHNRVLSIRGNGEPSWVTRATINTSETRREKGAKS
ncbi:hypothetical protein EDB85DRAFT_2278460 [Lactarius pseudohatsudake]|nr:hypothetical protein EDB85DRAFT_2278460 [Lactarius pseudohatsudake]